MSIFCLTKFYKILWSPKNLWGYCIKNHQILTNFLHCFKIFKILTVFKFSKLLWNPTHQSQKIWSLFLPFQRNPLIRICPSIRSSVMSKWNWKWANYGKLLADWIPKWLLPNRAGMSACIFFILPWFSTFLLENLETFQPKFFSQLFCVKILVS